MSANMREKAAEAMEKMKSGNYCLPLAVAVQFF